MLRWPLTALCLLILVIILTQDFQVYTELVYKYSGHPRPYQPPQPTDNAADFFATTTDGERIHFRRWSPTRPPTSKLRAAILSHGNAGTMDAYVTIPRWLASLGIATYVYDYRGYGRSTGWPSENGIYRDAEAIFAEAQRRDNATPATTLAFGHSLGGGPSTYLAERHNLAVLITAATYTSVPDRAALHPFFGRLSPWVWPNFPNRERIARLKDTCLIVLHAHNDDTMPLSMARQLVEAHKQNAHFAEHPTAYHGDIVKYVPELAGPLLNQCAIE